MATSQLTKALTHEGMEVIGQLKVTGNVKCTHCGQLTTCPMSSFSRLFNGERASVPEAYCRVEDQHETWQQAQTLGQELARRIQQD